MTPDEQAFITTIIAVYGAVIASLSLALSIVLGIAELRRDKPRLRVTASHGSLMNMPNIHSEPLIIIEAINIGRGQIIIDQFGYILKDRSKRVLLKPYMLQLPITLDERRRLNAFYACRWFRNDKDNSKIVAFYFKDEAGGIWKAKITGRLRKQILDAKDTGYLIEWSRETQSYFLKDRDENPVL